MLLVHRWSWFFAKCVVLGHLCWIDRWCSLQWCFRFSFWELRHCSRIWLTYLLGFLFLRNVVPWQNNVWCWWLHRRMFLVVQFCILGLVFWIGFRQLLQNFCLIFLVWVWVLWRDHLFEPWLKWLVLGLLLRWVWWCFEILHRSEFLFQDFCNEWLFCW